MPQRHKIVIAVAGCVTIAVAVTCFVLLRSPDPDEHALPTQFGVNVYISEIINDSDTAYTTRADRDFAYLKRLGANAVSLFFPVFTDGPRGSTVSVKPKKTPPPERLRLVIRSAQRHHLRVTLRPAVDQTNLMTHGEWRGTLQPANREQWFSTYTEVLLPYLQMAQDMHVETVDIGLELNTLEGDPHWAGVVKKARAVYHGQLAYSVHWRLLEDGEHEPPIPDFGINAYPSLDLRDNASQAEVTAAWNNWLDHVGRGRDLKNVTLDEVGIPSTPGAYDKPWQWDSPDMVYLPHVQVRWFTAACEAMKAHRMAGIYFWKIDFDKNPGKAKPASDPPSSFIGRASETAVRQCFAR